MIKVDVRHGIFIRTSPALVEANRMRHGTYYEEMKRLYEALDV